MTIPPCCANTIVMMRKYGILIGATVVAVIAAGGFWYLQDQSAENLSADPTNPELVRIGQIAYRTQCAACHGRRLEGEPNWRQRRSDGTLPAPPHDETGHTWHHADKLLFDITKYGGQRNAPPGFRSRMPGFGAALTDREIYAVLAYIKSRWPTAVRKRQERINAQVR